MDARTVTILLRLIHVLAGIFWAGTAFMVAPGWLPADDWSVANSTRVDVPGKVDAHPDPYAMAQENKSACATDNAATAPEVIKPIRIMTREERQAVGPHRYGRRKIRILPDEDLQRVARTDDIVGRRTRLSYCLRRRRRRCAGRNRQRNEAKQDDPNLAGDRCSDVHCFPLQ